MGAAAAIAGVGAAASIGGSLISSSASKSAANTQAAAATSAAQLQQQEQQQVRADLSPYNQTGQQANAELASLYGLTPSQFTTTTTNGNPLTSAASTDPIAAAIAQIPGINGSTTTTTSGGGGPSATSELAALHNTPGYQFALTQGLQSTQNSAAARGLGTSGAALKGAATYAEGLADNTYQTNLLNPLEYLSGQGESAAAQTGVLGTQGAANAGAGLVGAGNASAAGTVGSANALAGGLSSAAGSPLNYLLYQNLLGGGNGASSSNFYNSSGNSAPGAASAAAELGPYY